MSLSVVVKPNADFTSGNITRALLNQAAKPTIAVAGSIGTEEIEALSITGAKIADNAVSGTKLTDGSVGFDKLNNLGRGNVLVGQAKDEDAGFDGGDTVLLKLPENGFLVGDGNDVKAMVFDSSASGPVSMSQYTDSSTGDTSFKFDLRSLGVRSSHVASRAINLSKLSPNGGTAVTELTDSAIPSYDGGNSPDGTNYGLATLTVAGGSGTVLKSNGRENALTFGSVMKHVGTSGATLDEDAAFNYAVAHNFKEADGTTKVVPSFFRVVVLCTANAVDSTHGYAAGDELDLSLFCQDQTEDQYITAFADNTNITVRIGASNDMRTLTKTGSAPVDLKKEANDQDFKIKVYAAY